MPSRIQPIKFKASSINQKTMFQSSEHGFLTHFPTCHLHSVSDFLTNIFSPFHIFLEIPAGTIRCYFYLDFVNYAAAEEEEKVQQ